MRIIFFIGVFLTGICVPFVLFLIPLIAYLCIWSGFELLIIGVIIDSIFGTGKFPYMYTATIGVLLIAATFARPYMSWYDTDISSL